MDDPNIPQQVLPDYQSNDANIPSYGDLPKGVTPVNQATNEQPVPKDDDISIVLDPKEKLVDTKKIIGIVIGAIAGIVVLAVAIVLIPSLFKNNNDGGSDGGDSGQGVIDTDGKPVEISMQHTVKEWTETQANADNSAVLIYDIDNDSMVARHNEDTVMRMESIFTMFVAYEGYYRVDHYTYDPNSSLGIGSDYTGNVYTIRSCLDYMIRYSYYPCAEAMGKKIGWEALQASFKDQGFKSTDIPGLTSTANDIVKLYRMYWKHNDLNTESWNKILDTMLNQTSNPNNVAYNMNWRRGLPSGFSTANIYNKTGFYTTDDVNYYTFADAAFIVFPAVESNEEGKYVPERHYIMAILTKDTNPQEIVKLGRKIEELVKTTDNYK